MKEKVSLEYKFDKMTVDEQEAFMEEHDFDERARAGWRVARAHGYIFLAMRVTPTSPALFYTWGVVDEELMFNTQWSPARIEQNFVDICHDACEDGNEEYIVALKDELYRRFCAEANIDT